MTPFGATSGRAVNRRGLLAGASALLVWAALPASAWAQADATPAGGEWSFTDDAGATITREQTPERIVAYMPLAAALWDFGIRPIEVYGTTHKPDGTPEIYAGNVDLESVTSLGPEYGALDIEGLVALQPDLLVNDMWADPPDVWGLEPDIIAQVECIAPIAQIKFVDRPISATIASVEALAGALGADLDAEEVMAARAEFEKAAEDVRAAASEIWV
jgi:iron complex transport system substrate-binding protein